jgi:hypothetical protein
MGNMTFKAPGYFDREFDLTQREAIVGGVPATVIGAAKKGPAFVPVTLGGIDDFKNIFGDLDPALPGGYAAERYFAAKENELASLNYIRVLGCGANSSSAEIEQTKQAGVVTNAGMSIYWSGNNTFMSGARPGVVQFLVGKHVPTTDEAFGFPEFTNNNSVSAEPNLVRAVLFSTDDARFMVMSGAASVTYNPATFAAGTNNYESARVGTEGLLEDCFKIIISSSAGASFASDDGFPGLRILTASLNPSSDYYVAKVLNTSPDSFEEKKHILWLHYPVDAEVAALSASATTATVAVLSGSQYDNDSALGAWSTMFGTYDARYAAPKTPWFISQPFGNVEYDLFRVVSRDDGEYANTKVKVSIADLRASTDPSTEFGTFTLMVRAFDDLDTNPQILETFGNLSLDPSSPSYIAKAIGDMAVSFNFDAEEASDKNILVTGKYKNISRYIRIETSNKLESREVPSRALPFGFHGYNVLLTNSALTDATGSLPLNKTRITGVSASTNPGGASLSGSIVPPIPFRFTVTRNDLATSGAPGAPGVQTVVDGRFYWGVKFERNNDVLNTNAVVEKNAIIENFAKFSGIEKLDVLVTGSGADTFNNNKFSLAKVALGITSLANLTGSAAAHMRDTAYLRNATLNPSTYAATNFSNRITLASILNSGSAVQFNNFSGFAKFTAFLAGGWDGVNPFDKQARRFSDQSTSEEVNLTQNGLASPTYTSPGAAAGTNFTGVGEGNSSVVAYRTAIDIATNAAISNCNIIAIPGQRDPLVTDYGLEKVAAYGLAVYPADIPQYDSTGTATGRIFDGQQTAGVAGTPSVVQTSNALISRALDNSYAAAYFPNCTVEDSSTSRRLSVPGSVAAISAFSYNDRNKFPWFAPAGFDRGSLSFVKQTAVKINQADRDRLYDAHINPITKFPGTNYVFFSQNTLLQNTNSALSSINVRRMLIEIKRQIIDIANRLMFEQNNATTRKLFVDQATLVLATVQNNQGIEKFSIICDTRNNTANDVNSNRMNARISVVPTRAVEYILMDFVITPSGVTFQ